MSIHNLWYKIKRKTGLDSLTVVYILVILGVGFSAFGLGRLSVSNDISTDNGVTITGVKSNIETASVGNIKSESLPAIPAHAGQAGNYVASKNGKLYYTRGCKAANRIKPENEVWFDTASDAQKSGYAPSASCK